MPEVAARHGDFDAWFLRALGGEGLECRVTEVTRQAPPDPEGAAGILVTGSLASAYADEPWIVRLAEWLRAASTLGVPVLGVCFGHQILARALGGRVRRHPEGREVGTPEVFLTPEGREDWLFRGVPERFPASLTHDDEVEALPPGAVRLAFNGHTAVQAFGFGEHCRGVQFHPEIDAAIMGSILSYKAGAGLLPAEAAAEEAVRATPEAARVLANFAARVRGGR
jgi:GMP synthase (glutamine-hydrolysing)